MDLPVSAVDGAVRCRSIRTKAGKVVVSLARSWRKMASGRPVGKNITNGEDALFLVDEQASCGNREGQTEVVELRSQLSQEHRIGNCVHLTLVSVI